MEPAIGGGRQTVLTGALGQVVAGVKRSGFVSVVGVLLLSLAACTYRGPPRAPAEPIAPIPASIWREIEEEIWTASSLAYFEAEAVAREGMREWMKRVRAETGNAFIPWYTGYWTQQWIGVKAGWYELGREDGDAPVEEYLAGYLQERYTELVLEPAGVRAHPQSISEQAAALYVRLLSQQLQCIPKIYPVSPRSLGRELDNIPLIRQPGGGAGGASLQRVFERNDLSGLADYDALLGYGSRASLDESRLLTVAEDSLARLVAGLPLRAGGGAAATVIGEALGLIVSAAVAAWSAVSHEQQRPELESQVRAALNDGLDRMWEILMEDPEVGVMYPINHMSDQIEAGLFPISGPEAGSATHGMRASRDGRADAALVYPIFGSRTAQRILTH